MKQPLLSTVILLIISGCKADLGFREVSTEIEIETPQYGTICSSLELYTTPPYTQGPNNDGGCVGISNSDLLSTSQPYAYPVGTNLSYDFRIEAKAEFIDPVTRILYYVDTTISCDIFIKIKADEKVIWSKKYKNGDKPENDQEVGNIIIR